MFRSSLLLFVGLLTACGTGSSSSASGAATSSTPEQLLTQLRERLDHIETLQYDFHYQGSGSMSGEYRGWMKIRTGGEGPRPQLAAEIQDWSSAKTEPNSITRIASDGETVRRVDETGSKYLAASLDQGAAQILINAFWGVVIEFIAPKAFFTPGKSTFVDRGTVTVNGVPCHRFEQITEVPGGRTRIGWWLGTEDLIPRRQTWINEIPSAYGEMTLDLHDLRLDREVDDSVFSPSRPDGFRIESWEGPEIRPGKPAPSFSLTDRAGEKVTLEQFRGRLVLLSFWATWCPKCLQLKEELEEIAAEYADAPFSVVGINVWEQSQDLVDRYLAEQNPAYTILRQGDEVAQSYRLATLPGIFLIGPDGRFVQVDPGIGWVDLSRVRQAIRSALSD